MAKIKSEPEPVFPEILFVAFERLASAGRYYAERIDYETARELRDAAIAFVRTYEA